MKIIYNNQLIDIDELSGLMTEDELIHLIEVFGFPGWASPGFYRCVELGFIEEGLDEWDYIHAYIERDPATLH
tara:strand:+ start:52 stop:270 length:219 start_codon:yes stop_codon:yes gene_type:complete